MKTVNLICPVYNSETYLQQLIDSIKNQSYPFFDCLFIDDASTDNSINIIQSINDKRFTLIINKENQGAQKCRQKGYESCHGAYVAFIDSDDFLDMDYLKRLMNKLEEDDSDIVMCQYDVINDQNKVVRVNHDITPIAKELFPLEASCHKAVIMSKPAFWNKLFTYSFLKESITFPDVPLAQDLSIIPILLSKAKISYVDEVLYHYRIKEKSISNSYDRRLLKIHQSFQYLTPLKQGFYSELEFMAIGHYFFQISKALFIKDKGLRLSIYRELKQNLKREFPNYQKNIYFRKRLDYRIFTLVLRQKIIFHSPLIHFIVSFLLKRNFIYKWIRKSDR